MLNAAYYFAILFSRTHTYWRNNLSSYLLFLLLCIIFGRLLGIDSVKSLECLIPIRCYISLFLCNNFLLGKYVHLVNGVREIGMKTKYLFIFILQ